MIRGSPRRKLLLSLAAGGASLCLVAAGVRAAPAEQAAWAVPKAPYRALVRLKEAPSTPETGAELAVPDLGVTGSQGGDYAMTDAAGHPVPVAVVWQAPQQGALLLASGLRSGEDYFLYIGGPKGTTWTPATSLLLETRHSPYSHGEAFGSAGSLQGAWASAPSWGAGFERRIFSGNNPFGEQTNFLSHYSGYLAPTHSDIEIGTDSSDASFVLVNDQLFLSFPGVHPATSAEKSMPIKKLPGSNVPIKIDYYQAKGATEGEPAMSLDWKRGKNFESIPEDAWLHPGRAQVARFDAIHGGPVPAPELKFPSYVGWGGGFLYELHARLAPTELENATVEWHFDDGGVFSGPEVTRIVAANPPIQRVTVVLKRGAETVQSTHQFDFYAKPPEPAEGDDFHAKYVALLAQQDPRPMSAAFLGTALSFLIDNALDDQVAPYANAWLATKHALNDPVWLGAESARARVLAQTDPKAAIAELSNNFSAHELYARPLNLLTLELIVFYAHDLAMLPRAQQIGFDLGSTPDGRLAAIRIGDLYRINGDLKQAVTRYEAVQPPDNSDGRQLPAQDQANSMTVADLIERGDRQGAEAKLIEWELAHPMTKFTTDFLLLRSRVMTLYGRWREALTELDTFAATQPDSAYQIEVDFYRARCLYALGKKEEARKIWGDIIKNYPKSSFADSSKEWVNKP